MGRSVGRTAARKRLAAIKAMMKNKARPEGAAAEPAGRGAPQEEEEPVTFDGGFFRVESPARPFLGQTPKSARRSSGRATPRSTSRAFLRSCVDSSVARLGTPAAYRSCPPLPDPDASAGLSRMDLSRVFDQSDTQAAEGSSAAVDGVAEEAGETQTASSDSASRSSGTNDSGPVDSQGAESPDAEMNESSIAEDVQQTVVDLGDEDAMCSPEKDVRGTESPDAEKNESDMAEEVQRTTMDLGEEDVMDSPEKDALFEGASSPGEEQHTPARQTGPVLDDFSHSSVTPEGKPHMDCSLFFTPLKNEAQKFAAATSDNDLIVFSPLPFPAGEK